MKNYELYFQIHQIINMTSYKATTGYSSGISGRLSLDLSESEREVQQVDPSKHVTSDIAVGYPIEQQLYEVDMNDPKMDALEWAVRKIIPIPKAYYWDTGNTNLPMKTKAWHQIVSALSGVVAFIDRVGKPVVDLTGLTTSRFDYIKSTMTETQLAKVQKIALERKLRNEASRRDMVVEEGRTLNPSSEVLK
jgi:hypothetical protein